MRKEYGDTSDEISIGEYTINQKLDEILRDIYKEKPDMLCLSCYIWNLTYVERDLQGDQESDDRSSSG